MINIPVALMMVGGENPSFSKMIEKEDDLTTLHQMLGELLARMWDLDYGKEPGEEDEVEEKVQMIQKRISTVERNKTWWER